jgi:hypothetical protein
VPHAPDGRQVAIAQSAAMPAGQDRPGGLPANDDDCPICAAVQLAASGLVPPAPMAPCPTEFVETVHRPFIALFGLPITRHVLFQTRAPPSA